MTDPEKDDKRPFVFWLIQVFLPHDDDSKETEPMSDREFYLGLALSLALVIAAGILIRSCNV